MICKNCRQAQEQAFNYCPNCGAEVVKARLRLGVLVRDFFLFSDKFGRSINAYSQRFISAHGTGHGWLY
jgi:hypothetical protein